MAERAHPLPPLTGHQAKASRPEAHVWLSASAGVGKTQVLAARVFRLLLRGVDPGAILCLTFTKAGAAEMAERISRRLAAWVRMRDEDLLRDLQALGERGDRAQQALARTLFAKVLDAPSGGIRISTIHGFCQSLLAAFPMEAGLVPGFRPLEPREEAALARETLAQLLIDAERDGRSAPVEAIGALSVRLGEGGAEAFLAACAKAPEAMAALPTGIKPYLRRMLGLPSGDVEAEIERCCGDEVFDVDALRRIAAANRAWGTPTGLKHVEVADNWIRASGSERVAALEALARIALTGKGEPRKPSAKLVDAEADYVTLLAALGERCAELLALRRRAAYADLLAAALAVGRDYADAYVRAKRRLGAIDFDDLIRAAVALLQQPGIGQWVRYKLDQGTEHILIDEAQDTNLAQWKIIDALAEEFFAGEGARGDRVRTLFTVGDFKQAIFGFQGTDPIYFRWAEGHFHRKAQEAAVVFDRLSLTQSFRSTAPILEFVDAAVAATGEPGLGAVGEVERHASRVPGPGAVTLWPAVTAEDDEASEDEEGWIGDATRILAGRIARQVRAWLDEGMRLESKGRVMRPEDVMILVKRRGELASLLVARLHAEGVPVAGVDRLKLNAPLAVQDLLAAVRFALQPDDDLSLACLLVSPLFGWSQEELMRAAVNRRGSLWRHLRQTQPRDALRGLDRILARADFTTPYQFLEELLSGELEGRRKLLLRLGAEARDPIEELLNAALEFEMLATPSLQAFLDWFDRGDVEIVRDPSAPVDAVRVMTAHGAKGLQAPVVILADATADPGAAPRGTLKWSVEEGVALPIFRPRAEEVGGPLDAVIAESGERELAEHWRLFYVAATRAEEQLVIAGALGPRAKGVPPETSWYAACDRALTVLGVPSGDGAARRFTGLRPEPPVTASPKRREAVAASPVLPNWVRELAPLEPRPTRPLAPSALGEDDVADPPPAPAMRIAAERGRLIHALFERLPAVPENRRRETADRWLVEQGGMAEAIERKRVIDDVMTVIADPRLADLFGPDALAEAPIAAVVNGGLVVSGTIDRLLVGDEVIKLVDFKTGRRAPANLDDIPPYHLRQMAAYVAALAVIFPSRRIEAKLLYTAAARLFELPSALLDRHKPGLSNLQQSLPGAA